MGKLDYQGNIAAQAWDETKADGDPAFAEISEIGFRENLEFRAVKVKETGVAITPFEKRVATLLEPDATSEPLAVEPDVVSKQTAKAKK